LKDKAAKLNEKYRNAEGNATGGLYTDIIALAAGEGFDFSEVELDAYFKAPPTPDEASVIGLSEDELDAVAGGRDQIITDKCIQCFNRPRGVRTCTNLQGTATHVNPPWTCSCTGSNGGGNMCKTSSLDGQKIWMSCPTNHGWISHITGQ
jgi:hypothetical protein